MHLKCLGLLFFANEDPKMLQYFVPAIGTAPKWCSYLEAITEELEETEQPAGLTCGFAYIPLVQLCVTFLSETFLYRSVTPSSRFRWKKSIPLRFILMVMN